MAAPNYALPILAPFVVATSNTVRQGMPVKLSSGYLVECSAAGDTGIGIARSVEQRRTSGGAWTAAAGETVMVALNGHGVVPIRVGTGGVTAGAMLGLSATEDDGLTDITFGAGTVARVVYAQALETSATVGALVPANLGCFSATVTA